LALDLQLPPWVDIVAFSSTTWEDAKERPRELMTRCAKSHRVFFFQKQKYDACDDPYLELSVQQRVNVVTPHLRKDSVSERNIEKLIGLLLSLAEIHQYIFWYFSPLAIEYTGQFGPRAMVYDCMNEPAGLRKAFPDMYEVCKRKLTSAADMIFTTDLAMCLDPNKRNVHLFADAVDPKSPDWDELWKEMSRLINRTFKNTLPHSKATDTRT
jgi:hypothetical protein